MPKRGTVWLVGMMGAGKSTVGPALAERLDLPFLDTDALIGRAAGQSVAEIFDREGEAAFRERERAAIDEVAGSDAVVAVGGGAIAQPGAPDRLSGTGCVVYLRAGPDALLARMGACEERPLLRGLSDPDRRRALVALLEARRESYESATVVIETDGRTPDAIADALAARLAEATGR